MSQRCAVSGCVHMDPKRFTFPKSIERAEKWREFCQNPRLDNISSERLHYHNGVCGRHFARHQFTNDRMERLNRDMVPTLFPPVPDSIDTNHSIPQDASKDVCAPIHNIVELNVTIPPIDNENTNESAINSVSANPSNKSNNCDFNEVMYPVSSDDPSPPLASCNIKESELSLLKSSTTEVILNEYYRYTLCRLCFCQSNSLTNIFEESQECGFHINDAIEDLLQFKVSKTDDFPQFICPSCCVILGKFKVFKDTLVKMKAEFEKSLYKLRKSPENVIKMDVISDQNESGMVGDLNECKNDAKKHFSEMKETDVEDLVADYHECLSDSEDAASGFEETGADEQAETETRKKVDPNMLEIVLEEEYKCNDCGEVFQFRNHLTNHRKEHEKTWPLACSYCDKRFKSLMELNNHIIRHSNYKPYECEHCGLRCRLKATLFRHKMRHSDDRPFLCSTCGVSFRQRGELRKHLRTHSSVKCYKCEECGAEFKRSGRLISHYETHSKETPNVCGDCGKSFRVKKTLIQHVMSVHQNEKRFECEICSKRFSVKKYLQGHMKIHRKQLQLRTTC